MSFPLSPCSFLRRQIRRSKRFFFQEEIIHPERTGWFTAGETPCDPVPPLAGRPYRLVLLGPPGVGKGTQANLLCEQLRACHLSTDDLFRSAKCGGESSPAMKEALEAMQRGELIGDELVIAMVRETLNITNGLVAGHDGLVLINPGFSIYDVPVIDVNTLARFDGTAVVTDVMTIQRVPEPSSLLLVGLAGVLIGCRRRRV